MSIIERLASRFRRETVSLELDDIQALILRSRPEPYVGLHAMLHFDEAEGARDLQAFAEAWHLPVGNAMRFQDTFDNRHPLYAGDVGIATFKMLLVNMLTDALPAATTVDAAAQLPVGRRIALSLRAENIGDARVVTRNAGGSIDLGTPRTLWIGVRLTP